MSERLIEIGWVIAGTLDSPDREAVESARNAVQAYLTEAFSDYEWSLPLVVRDELVDESRVEPVVLLEAGLAERNMGHWDFAIVLTGADLIGRDRHSAIAVVSRALESAVISTSRIDPRARRVDTPRDERVAVLARWVEGVVLHFLGHFGGLGDGKPGTCMHHPSEIEPPTGARYGERELELLARRLPEIADPRLEERESFRTANPVVFYLASVLRNARELVAAIREAEPWRFPLRLSKLSIAAMSTLFVLCMTEETWAVATTQTPEHAIGLSSVSVLAPMVYVLVRQRLLVTRPSSRLTEQHVITNVTTVAVVFFGMLTTFLVLFGFAFALAHTLFSDRVIARWTEGGASGVPPTLLLSATVASLGLVIGALGASFEHEHEFRHTLFVDEEV